MENGNGKQAAVNSRFGRHRDAKIAEGAKKMANVSCLNWKWRKRSGMYSTG